MVGVPDTTYDVLYTIGVAPCILTVCPATNGIADCGANVMVRVEPFPTKLLTVNACAVCTPGPDNTIPVAMVP